MALARVKTWNPGDTLTAADLNAEFNNPLNNPITLISPTTGAINFQTSVAHINLIPTAITGSSAASAGAALIATSSAPSTATWSTGYIYGSTAKTMLCFRYGHLGTATALTSNNFTLSSGWGSTAVLQSIAGGDQAYTFTILTGSTMGGNPTVTTTFADGPYLTTGPLASVAALTGGTGVTSTAVVVTINVTNNSTGQLLQMFLGNPSTGLTYKFSVINF